MPLDRGSCASQSTGALAEPGSRSIVASMLAQGMDRSVVGASSQRFRAKASTSPASLLWKTAASPGSIVLCTKPAVACSRVPTTSNRAWGGSIRFPAMMLPTTLSPLE